MRSIFELFSADKPYSNAEQRLEYYRLSNLERPYYFTIIELIEGYKTTFTFQNVPFQTIAKVYAAVLKDNPQYFWLSGACKGSTQTIGYTSTLTFEAELNDGMNAYEIPSLDKRFCRTVNEIVSAAKKYIFRYTQVLFVHDYLVDNTDYISYAPQRYNAYGCLVDRRAVCAGYAAAFQVILQRLGIFCCRVTGCKASDYGSKVTHEWNYVQIGGDFSYIDVTWDDPLVEGGVTGDNKSHDYFCITTNELLLTHRIVDESPVPICTGRWLDYYAYKGYYLERYSFSDAEKIAKKQLAKGNSFSIKFSCESETRRAIDDLVKNQKVYKIDGVSQRLRYSTNNTSLVLTIKSDY